MHCIAPRAGAQEAQQSHFTKASIGTLSTRLADQRMAEQAQVLVDTSPPFKTLARQVHRANLEKSLRFEGNYTIHFKDLPTWFELLDDLNLGL